MPEVKWPKLSKAQVGAVAPVRQDGTPDTYNFMPTRFISKEEAEARGWSHFYLGDVCAYGHKAPRFVTNGYHCVDCNRMRKGKLPIGGKGEAERVQRRNGKPRAAAGTGGSSGTPVAAVAAPIEPDALEKRFLTAYAASHDFDTAAREVRKTAADFQARLSYSKVFREAVERLEDELGLIRTAATTDDFEWTDEKRITLQRTYVNTGNLTAAISSVGATNWDYETELQENPEFAETMLETERIAVKMLDRTAVSKGIDGSERLLMKVLPAKLPEYGERVNVNMNVQGNITDDQLNQRLVLAFEQLGGRIIDSKRVDDGATAEPDARAALEAPAGYGAESIESSSQSNSDLL